MEFTRREQMMIGFIVVLIITGSSIVFWRQAEPVPVVNNPPPVTEQSKEPVKHKNIIIYVSGEVKHPGVVSMVPGSRVIDAVNLLGGTTEMADLRSVNMAAPLVDGQQIHVPGTEEAGGGPAVTVARRTAVGKISINTADVAALDMLPGIGPSTAQKIIDYRTNQGPFASLEDLKNVPGIGENKYNNLKEKITL